MRTMVTEQSGEKVKKEELIGRARAFADKVKRGVTEIVDNGERETVLSSDKAGAVEEVTLGLWQVLNRDDVRLPEYGYHSLTLICENEDVASEKDLKQAETEHIIQHLRVTLYAYEALYDAFERDDQKLVVGLLGLDAEEQVFKSAWSGLKTFYMNKENQVKIAKTVTCVSLIHDAWEAQGRLVHEDKALEEAEKLMADNVIKDEWLVFPGALQRGISVSSNIVMAGIESSRMNTKIPVPWRDMQRGSYAEEESWLADVRLQEMLNLHMVMTHRADYEVFNREGYRDLRFLGQIENLPDNLMAMLVGESLIEKGMEEQLNFVVEDRSNTLDKVYGGSVLEMMYWAAGFQKRLMDMKFALVEKLLELSNLSVAVKNRLLLERSLELNEKSVEIYKQNSKLVELRCYQAAVLVAQQSKLTEEQASMGIEDLKKQVEILVNKKDADGVSRLEKYALVRNEWKDRQAS